MSIEYMIQSNNIEGVRSLDSTGQIIPLTMGVATALSLLYLWVKNFFNRGTVSTPLLFADFLIQELY